LGLGTQRLSERCPSTVLGEEVASEMKEWECVQVSHHKDIGNTIVEWQKKGWRLYSYQATGTPTAVNHYLLFEKGD